MELYAETLYGIYSKKKKKCCTKLACTKITLIAPLIT